MKIPAVMPYAGAKSFKGSLYLDVPEENFLNSDHKKIEDIENKMEDKPYDIYLKKGDFGYYYTKVKHENGKQVSLDPIAIPISWLSIPDYIEKIMDLIEINK